MGYWGKIIGGMAGFAVGGPFGAMVGAALGHAADSGQVPNMGGFSFSNASMFNPARIAAMLGRRDQVFSICVVVLAAKLAKCDGPVNRSEIDAFKRQLRIPPEAVRDVGRLFDQAREDPTGFETYATQLGEAFEDNHGVLEDVLSALLVIARADGPVNAREQDFLAARPPPLPAIPGGVGAGARRRAAPVIGRVRTPMPSSVSPGRPAMK